MNALVDLMPTLTNLTASLRPDVQAKLATAMDAAIISGALEERAQVGGFEMAATEQLESMYAHKVSQVTGKLTTTHPFPYAELMSAKSTTRNVVTSVGLEREITAVLNRASRENASNTPDYILAQYLIGCLESLERAVQQRETHHGRNAAPADFLPGTGQGNTVDPGWYVLHHPNGEDSCLVKVYTPYSDKRLADQTLYVGFGVWDGSACMPLSDIKDDSVFIPVRIVGACNGRDYTGT